MGIMLERWMPAYGHPVDIEFTAAIEAGRERDDQSAAVPPPVPSGIRGAGIRAGDQARGQVLFRSERMINGGVIRNIRYHHLHRPRGYSAIPVAWR